MLANVFINYINQNKIMSMKFNDDTKSKENIWVHQMWRTVTLRKQAKYKFHTKYKFKFTKYDFVDNEKICKIFWPANNIKINW